LRYQPILISGYKPPTGLKPYDSTSKLAEFEKGNSTAQSCGTFKLRQMLSLNFTSIGVGEPTPDLENMAATP
jgi:hypothetical protein